MEFHVLAFDLVLTETGAVTLCYGGDVEAFRRGLMIHDTYVRAQWRERIVPPSKPAAQLFGEPT